MAAVVESIQALKKFDEGVHWFCPREFSGDETLHFEEDLDPETIKSEDAATKKKRLDKIASAVARRKLVLRSLEILAYDGNDAAPYKALMVEGLGKHMTSCEVCIRVYHNSRPELKEQLEMQYEAEQVDDFLDVVDEKDNARIITNLRIAEGDMGNVDPKDRRIGRLDPVGAYGLLEALSSERFLADESRLESSFDRPFQMLQTEKRLKVKTYNPAMTLFLFCLDDFKRNWAFTTWIRFPRELQEAEFDTCVKNGLRQAMSRVHPSNVDKAFLPVFWNAARVILEKMDKTVITNCLRAMDPDIFRLALDHLHLKSAGFEDLVVFIRMLLEKSPQDFWDAMGTVSPTMVVEQIFNSSSMHAILVKGDMAEVEDILSWTSPFLRSLKPSSLVPACGSFANYLMKHLQSNAFSQTTRFRLYRVGLEAMLDTLGRFNEGQKASTFVGRAISSAIFEMVDAHTPSFLHEIHGVRKNDEKNEDAIKIASLGLDIIHQAIVLDCLTLAVEGTIILKGTGPAMVHEIRPQSSAIWQKLVKSVIAGDTDIVTKTLSGAHGLYSLEKIICNRDRHRLTPSMKQFNATYDTISQHVCDLVEKTADFPLTDLRRLFSERSSCNAIIGALLSSHSGTNQATVELLKMVANTDDRQEALEYILKTYYTNVLYTVSLSVTTITKRKIFEPAPRMLRVCSELHETLTDQQVGILRLRSLTPEESAATRLFWQRIWEALKVLFEETETFHVGGRDTLIMKELCRDIMELAGKLFDSYSLLATALGGSGNTLTSESGESRPQPTKDLLLCPKNSLKAMMGYLRLKDEFLLDSACTLIKKIFQRLHRASIIVENEPIDFITSILGGQVKTRLSDQQLAELEQAIEQHGATVIKGQGDAELKLTTSKTSQGRPGQTNLDAWAAGTARSASGGSLKTPSSTTLDKAKSTLTADPRKKSVASASKAPPKGAAKTAVQTAADKNEFLLKRQQEKNALAAARAKNAAAERGKFAGGIGGNALKGLGQEGRIAEERRPDLMVGSSSEDESSSDEDKTLWPASKTRKSRSGGGVDSSLAIMNKADMARRRRPVLSRAQLQERRAPNLTPFHKVLLKWEIFHSGDQPPNNPSAEGSQRILSEFEDAKSYRKVFEPLLYLEVWASIKRSLEECSNKPFTIRVVNILSVDDLIEVCTTTGINENKDFSISEGELVILSKYEKPMETQDKPHCLARVFGSRRKGNIQEVQYRVAHGSTLMPLLSTDTIIYGVQIESLTTAEREYGSIQGLENYDLVDDILEATPAPLRKYSNEELTSLTRTYQLNVAQAKAVKSAVESPRFTLIQGPPGSGKTKTIVAIAGALLSNALGEKPTTKGSPDNPQPERLLICAPSNAAVDEIIMRLKQGVVTQQNVTKKIPIVRLGRTDAVNQAVKDVTLEELVAERISGNQATSQAQRSMLQDLMSKHKELSATFRDARARRDQAVAAGSQDVQKMTDEVNMLAKEKSALGAQVDRAKDKQGDMTRQHEVDRKQAQREILNNAKIVCSTLSGSGHEIFQKSDIKFDVVIVDEAAQCVELSNLIPLKYGCVKCILVGDPKQLPPTVLSRNATSTQYEQSLFVRMQEKHARNIHLLDTQYRMHPAISAFPSRQFYDGLLLDGQNMAELRVRPWHKNPRFGPYRFIDIVGRHQAGVTGRSLVNHEEITAAIQLYTRLVREFGGQYDFRGKIGIITPYKAQLRELRKQFSNGFGQDIINSIDFNTTDAFQGRESEIIIFSCVRAGVQGGIGFLKDVRRMNVGLTRAKSSLWVLGNTQSLIRGEFWKRLIENAQERGMYSKAIDGPNLPSTVALPTIVGRQSQIGNGGNNSTSASPTSATGTKSDTKHAKKAHDKPAVSQRRVEELNTEPSPQINDHGKRGMETIEIPDVPMLDAPAIEENKNKNKNKIESRSKKHVKFVEEPAPTSTSVGKSNDNVRKPDEHVGGRSSSGSNGAIPEPAPEPTNRPAARPPMPAPRRKKPANPFMPASKTRPR